MNSSFDTIIIGAGSMGSSAAYFLAKAGHKVLCLDRYSSPHVFGSHSGQSRIVRKAYFEHPDYVPLLNRSYQNWRMIEEESSQQLYFETGLLYLTHSGTEIDRGVRKAAQLHSLPLLELKNSDLNDRWPQIQVPENMQILFEEEAGFAIPELTINTLIKLAEFHGAVFKMPESALKWTTSASTCTVTTNHGIYTADKLIFCSGAWSSYLLPELKIPLKVSRQTLAWFETDSSSDFSPENFPCFMIEDSEDDLFYGFPVLPQVTLGGSGGLKIAHHKVVDYVIDIQNYTPQHSISLDEESLLRSILNKYLPGANGRLLQATTCLYTNSPDGDFILDFLPEHNERIIIACGFSGHGFKFVPVMGEILCDLAVKGRTDLNIDFLSLKRFD